MNPRALCTIGITLFFVIASLSPIPAEPVYPSYLYQAREGDWLIQLVTERAGFQAGGNEGVPAQKPDMPRFLVMDNGLVSRVFYLGPNFATADLVNRMTGDGLLRGVKPEARITLDGSAFDIGGLTGQPDLGYLDPAWLAEMQADPNAFVYSRLETGTPRARFPWKPRRFSENTPWPPRGVSLTAHFAPPAAAAEKYKGLDVAVHYELYDGLPVMAKWISITNGTAAAVTIDSATIEILAVNEAQTARFHAESTFAFDGMETSHWGPDLAYTSQVDYLYQSPVLFTSSYPLGPGARVEPGETFESYVTFEILHDSGDRERQGLFVRRMLRTLMPQVTENPIFMHVRNADSEHVRMAIDQCAAVGFEMVILTFWSGFDIESEDPAYIARFKADVEYAHAKGIEIGGYTLMCAS
ncbi:MAG TPA: alpha-galactosidase, partial [bacterium]|nr:alpha-galactosidase [bacterium]